MLDKLVNGDLTQQTSVVAIKNLFLRVEKVFGLAFMTFLFVAITLSGYSETYYVSNSGDDSRAGTTPETAWKTISKVNKHSFKPGDEILFKRGDEWRGETLFIEWSGEKGNPIIFGAYGSGVKPIFNGARTIKEWDSVNDRPNVWQTKSPMNDPITTNAGKTTVIIDDKLFYPVSSLKELDAEYEYYTANPSGISNDIIYIYSNTDPAIRKTEISVKQSGIVSGVIYGNGSTHQYITINDLEFRQYGYAGISVRGDGLPNINSYFIINNCDFKYIKNRAVDFRASGNNVVKNSTASYCGNGFYSAEGANNNSFYDNKITNIIRYAVDVDFTDGHAIGMYASKNNIVEKNFINKIEGNPIGCDESSATIRFNEVYINSNYEGGVGGVGAFTILKGDTVNVYYNKIIAETDIASCLYFYNVYGKANAFNNTLIQKGNNNRMVRLYHDAENVTLLNNIFYNISNTDFILELYYDGIPSSNNNLWFTNGSYVWNWGNGNINTIYKSLTDWTNANSQDNKSIAGDPLFVNPETGNYSLKTGSQAIDAGVDVGLSHDFNGNPIIGLPDIGAFEFQKKSSENQTINTKENIEICEGESYYGWKISGVYERTLTADSGADSIVTTTLKVNPVYQVSENIVIHEGENYYNWDKNGKYERILSSSTGCDSIVLTNLTVQPAVLQNINLEKGWNLFSSYIEPSNRNFNYLLKKLIDQDILIEVQNQEGKSFKKNGESWINNIGEFNISEGYKIKVRSDVNFEISGFPIELPFKIELHEGWNLISFSNNEDVNAMKVIQPLINSGNLIKVQDEKGNSIEYWDEFLGWINGIGNFKAGEGYWIFINKNESLTIYENYEKTGHTYSENLAPSNFKLDYVGNGSSHMNINIKNLDKSGLKVGDELATYNNNICVGAVKLSENNFLLNLVSIPASVSDNDFRNGFIEGEPIEIRTWQWNKSSVLETPLEAIEGNMIYQKHASVYIKFGSEIITGISDLKYDIEIYPNPAKTKLVVRYSEQPEIKTQIIITDLTGRQLMTHKVQSTLVKMDISSLPAGVYILKTTFRNSDISKKLIING